MTPNTLHEIRVRRDHFKPKPSAIRCAAWMRAVKGHRIVWSDQ